MTLLLVGGTGFLGAQVAARLAQEGRRFAVLARPTSDLQVLPPGADLRRGSLDDLASVARALEGVEAVLFCASMGFGHVPAFVEAAERAGVRRAVFVSTTAIFTSLPAPGRVVRLQAEAAVQRSRLDWTIIRPTMIYGSARDRNVSRLLRFLHRSPVFPVFGSGQAHHQPVFVDDLAAALLDALEARATLGRAYAVAGAAPCSYVELVRTAAAAVGRSVRLVYLPLRPAVAAARLASRVPGVRAPVTPEQVLRLAEDKAFDYGDAARDFGFRPRSFGEGVKLEAAALGLAPVEARSVARVPRL